MFLISGTVISLKLFEKTKKKEVSITADSFGKKKKYLKLEH